MKTPTQRMRSRWNRPALFALVLAVTACNAAAGIREPILDETMTCGNLVLDGTETDLDCGGSCSPCGTGKACAVSGDCESKICKGGACELSRCDDGVLNGGESDTDCGGPCAEKCADGKACGVGADCASMVCTEGVCQVPFCGDGVVQDALGEDCDDGNLIDDRCGASCKVQEVVQFMNGAGSFHTCVLLNDGRVKCWGSNDYGQLGLGDTNNRGDEPGEMGDKLPAVDLGTGKTAKALAAGYRNTCALLNDGSVKCWGWNEHGQLGLGDTNNRGDGPNEMGDKLPAVDLGTGKTAVAIVVGYAYACALLNDGNVKCWGDNQYSSLGLGDKNNRGNEPGEMGDNLPAVDLGTGNTIATITGGESFVCALMNDGSVKCWGYNLYGMLGLGDTNDRGDEPGEMGNALPNVDLGADKKVLAIDAGWGHTCVLLDDNTIKCWGWNKLGLLGLGDTITRGDNLGEMGDNLPAVDLGTGQKPMTIALTGDHACAFLNDVDVKCWGQNEFGQLGLGDTNHRGDEPGEMGDMLPTLDLGTGKKALTIAPLGQHTCSLLDDGSVKCWGQNEQGQLGLGDMEHRGDQPGEMGNALPTVKLFSDVW